MGIFFPSGLRRTKAKSSLASLLRRAGFWEDEGEGVFLDGRRGVVAALGDLTQLLGCGSVGADRIAGFQILGGRVEGALLLFDLAAQEVEQRAELVLAILPFCCGCARGTFL